MIKISTYDADVSCNVLHYATHNKVLILVARSLVIQSYCDVTSAVSNRPELLEAWLAQTIVYYHRNV